jgi:putative glutamine amidotransferase
VHLPRVGITMSTVTKGHAGHPRKHALNDPYSRWVREAGGLPFALPSVPVEAAVASAEAYLADLDGLLLSGGDDVDPARYGQDRLPACEGVDDQRDAFEIALARGARRTGLPVLAICRGIQVANVAFGGTLVQDLPTQVGTKVLHRGTNDEPAPHHDVSIEPGTRLRDIAGAATLAVNTFHHQAPDRLGEGLRATARSADGVVEGLEDPGHPFFVGVQWHPERTPGDPFQRSLFRAFLAAAQARKNGARHDSSPSRAGRGQERVPGR